MVNQITVDEDILKFLRAVCFGTYKDLYEAASNRAYLDMNRTLRFNGVSEYIRKKLRGQVAALLKKEIIKLKKSTTQDQDGFDKWHKSVCGKIQKKYKNAGINFTVGQAQKWINMTFKYLYMLGDQELADMFSVFHVPLDNYVLKIARREFDLKMPSAAWSRWNDYEKQYFQYQIDLRSKIKEKDPEKDPLRWEFEYWLKSARE